MAKKKGISLKAKLGVGIGVFIFLFIGCFLISPKGEIFLQKIGLLFKTLGQKSDLFLKQVIVKGHIHTSLKDLNQQINLKQGVFVYQLNLKEIHQKITEMPWIQSVMVKRILPDLLIIEITEKTPIAMWQKQQQYFPIDTNGQVIQCSKLFIPNIPLIVGENAPKHIVSLISTLKNYPKIYERLQSAVWVNNRRWQLILNYSLGQIEIELPDTEIEQAMDRLVQWQEKKQLFNKDVHRIDLRQSGKIIIRENIEGK